MDSESMAEIKEEHKDRLCVRLDALNAATDLAFLNRPGWHLHELKGKRKGFYSITVSGNFRLVFRFENNDVYDLTYEDYH